MKALLVITYGPFMAITVVDVEDTQDINHEEVCPHCGEVHGNYEEYPDYEDVSDEVGEREFMRHEALNRPLTEDEKTLYSLS